MRLIEELQRVACRGPVDRKILVCPNRGVGRELLRALAVRGTGWVGFEVTTPRSMALALAADRMGEEGRVPLDEFEERALLDEAIDEILEADAGPLGRLAEGVGFREAMANAVQALRLAGVEVQDLARTDLGNARKQAALRGILETYGRRMEERSRADGALIFRAAISRLAEGPQHVLAELAGSVWLVPGLPRGGLSGRFLDRLLEGGASALGGDPVRGLEPPVTRLHPMAEEPPTSAPTASAEAESQTGPLRAAQIDLFGTPTSMPAGPGLLSYLFDPPSAARPDGTVRLDVFAAASPYEEIREALRRVAAAERPWDEVEIVATDPVVYGSALDEIATRRGIPVTYAVGVPIERSRPGRAVFAYLDWISRDFPESVFRHLLGTGEVAPPDFAGEASVSGGRLARRLRRLRVGWGRERYLETIALRRRRLEERAAERGEIDPENPDRVAQQDGESREREELDALEAILAPILEATPPVPNRIGLGGGRVSPSELACALKTFLGFVPARSAVEHEARVRLLERLDRIEATLVRRTGFPAALAILRKHLDLRIPSPGAEGPPPWSAAGGHLHFSDLDHGGRTGRPVTFVVGLDAERFPGAGIQDPILLDDDRRRLRPLALPTAGEVLDERRFALAVLLAGLRGEVTLSYSGWEAASGREVPPASAVLQAHRLGSGLPHATYTDLRRSLGRIASALPRAGQAIDATDVWLDALREDRLFQRGERLIRAAFPGLDRGIQARWAPRGDAFTEHIGNIARSPAVLDPRRNHEVVVSATALERLGRCPLAYLHENVLGLTDPDDPELDPGTWLEAKDRGKLLHAVYEESLRRGRSRGLSPDATDFPAVAAEVLEEQIERFRGRVPVPSDAVFEREAGELREDLQVFVHMVRAEPPDWLDLERVFGFGEGGEPVELEVEGGVVRTRGIVDRIDRLPDGGLRVVDYKTGRPWDHRSKHGVYRGGRRLQHALYANAVGRLYGRPVEIFEYHFPTRRGDARPRRYRTTRLADAARVMGRLLDLVAAGHFLPTEDAEDCRYCDHRPICRVRADRWETHSPPADWSTRVRDLLPEYGPLNEVRRVED